MLNDVINKVIELLNNNDLMILKYAETDTYYLFEYGTKDYSPNFDNTMVKVDKKTNTASFYIITEHLEEINKLEFKSAK